MPYKDKLDQAEAARRHYLRNRHTVTRRAKDAKRLQAAAMRIYVNGLKQKPCVDCGGTFPPCAMQFDHLPDYKKRANVANMVKLGFSRASIDHEISKCELVCANCHSIRTEARRVVPPEEILSSVQLEMFSPY